MSIELPSRKESAHEDLAIRFPVLEVKEGDGVAGHIQPNIEIYSFDPKVRQIVRAAILDNRTDSLAYKLSKSAAAFLQGESDD